MIKNEFIKLVTGLECPKCNRRGLLLMSLGFMFLDVDGHSHYRWVMRCPRPRCTWETEEFDSLKTTTKYLNELVAH